MILLAASSFAGMLGTLVVLLAVVGLAGLGWKHGLFVATLAGLTVFLATLAALVFAPHLALFLESLELPPTHTLAGGYWGIFAIVVAGIRLAVGAFVTEESVRLPPLVDRIGGAVVGSCAGYVLAGALLIGWSMTALPESFRLDPRSLVVDPGAGLLRSLGRFLVADRTARTVLVEGDGDVAGSDQASEIYVDDDANALRGDAERYLDADNDGKFTMRPYGGRGRKPGLVECYQLAAWRGLDALHAPRITSPETGVIPAADDEEGIVYTAQVRDLDEEAQTRGKPTFALAAGGEDDAELFVIEPVTGVVKAAKPGTLDPKAEYTFTVVATDAAGLVTEQIVKVRTSEEEDDEQMEEGDDPARRGRSGAPAGPSGAVEVR